MCLGSNDGLMFKRKTFLDYQSKNPKPVIHLGASLSYLPPTEPGSRDSPTTCSHWICLFAQFSAVVLWSRWHSFCDRFIENIWHKEIEFINQFWGKKRYNSKSNVGLTGSPFFLTPKLLRKWRTKSRQSGKAGFLDVDSENFEHYIAKTLLSTSSLNFVSYNCSKIGKRRITNTHRGKYYSQSFVFYF